MTTILCKHCYRHVLTIWTRCPQCGTRLRSRDPRPVLFAAAAMLAVYYMNSNHLI